MAFKQVLVFFIIAFTVHGFPSIFRPFGSFFNYSHFGHHAARNNTTYNYWKYPYYRSLAPKQINFSNHVYCAPPSYLHCNGGHNLFLGCITYPIDKLLFTKAFVKQGRWWSTRQKIIEYPGILPPGIVSNHTISAIHVYDRNCNGTGGFASILSGGIGHRNVTIKLYSTSSGRGFDFLVQIYGR